MFNALRYTKILEEQGFTEGQAKASIEILIEIMNDQFATKADLKEFQLATKAQFKELQSKLTSDIKEMESRLSSDINGFKSDLKILEQK